MKRLFLDCQMGIAGDMLTATLLGLVDNPEIWIERLNQIGLPIHLFRKKIRAYKVIG